MRKAVHALLLAVAAPVATARAEAPAEARPQWSAALYVDAYAQPDEDVFVIPTLFADRGPLHLEVRYNYEAEDTTSLWAGWAFELGGEERWLRLTPMLGGVAGDVNGVAPGLEVEAQWGRVAYWLEAEYLLDLEDSAGNYLYTWSELTVSIVPWLWAGGSLQRLRVVETPTEVDVGPMVGAGKPGSWSLSFYAYGIATSAPSYLLTGALEF